MSEYELYHIPASLLSGLNAALFHRAISCWQPLSCCQPRNRRFADVIAFRQFLERFALSPPPPCFSLLLRRELRRAAHMLPARLGPATAFRRPGADKIALHVHQPA